MIPYNPSSFNSNKTILEQILELKNWLINHPQYEVYYCNDTALLSPVVNSFNLSDVPDNTNMDVGDLVVCNNAVYCTVISIDRDNGVFTAGYGISFKGDTGATGNDGKSIRVSSENYVNDSTAYSRANIQPVHSINQYDIVLFANDYIGYVSTISGVNFYVTATQNIKGDVGANGVSITNVTINASNHLIVTLSDGSTIDAGLINFSEEYVEVSTSSGTLSNDDRLKIIRGATLIYVDGNNKYYLEPYKYNNISQSIYYSNTRIESNVNEGGKVRATIHTITGNYAITIVSTNGKVVLAENIDSESQSNGKVLMANGSGGASWQTPSTPSIEGTSVLSTGATSGQVLQADGSGGASWSTIASGSNVVQVTSGSGTLSNDDYNKLLNNDSILVFFTGTTYIVYHKVLEDTSTLSFFRVTITDQYVDKFVITKATKAYTRTATNKLNYDAIDSSTASAGQVIQADGSGHCSWQTPSGGSQLYRHSIIVYSNDGKVYFRLEIINNSSTPFTMTSLNQYMYDNYGTAYGIQISGYYKNSSTDFEIAYEYNSVDATTGQLKCFKESSGTHQFSISNTYGQITEKVITL